MRKCLLLLILVLSIAAKAQVTANPVNKKVKLFSSIGVSTMDSDFKPASTLSIQTATGLEYLFSPHASLGATLGFDNYGYQKSGAGYNLDSKLKTTALSLFLRYLFGTKKISPYLKAGGGGAWLTAPVVTVGQGFTSIKNQTQYVGLLSGEAGIQIHLFSRYSMLLGVERDYMAKSSLLENAQLRATSVKVGLVSNF